MSFFSERVVQGVDATPVARLGLFAPRIDPLETSGDSARSHYQAFRTDQNRSGALTLVGLSAFLASAIVALSSCDGGFYGTCEPVPDAAWALLGVGATFSIAGAINWKRGRNHLHQAVWFYNRSLPAGP